MKAICLSIELMDVNPSIDPGRKVNTLTFLYGRSQSSSWVWFCVVSSQDCLEQNPRQHELLHGALSVKYSHVRC